MNRNRKIWHAIRFGSVGSRNVKLDPLTALQITTTFTYGRITRAARNPVEFLDNAVSHRLGGQTPEKCLPHPAVISFGVLPPIHKLNAPDQACPISSSDKPAPSLLGNEPASPTAITGGGGREFSRFPLLFLLSIHAVGSQSSILRASHLSNSTTRNAAGSYCWTGWSATDVRQRIACLIPDHGPRPQVELKLLKESFDTEGPSAHHPHQLIPSVPSGLLNPRQCIGSIITYDKAGLSQLADNFRHEPSRSIVRAPSTLKPRTLCRSRDNDTRNEQDQELTTDNIGL